MNFNLFGYMFLLLAVCFSLPLLIYSNLISKGVSSVPVLRVEKPRVADFSPVFKREEQKQQKEVSVRLLATAVGSVNLALIDTNGQVKTVRVGSEVGGYRVAHIDRNYIILSRGEEKKAIGFSFAKAEAKTTEPKAIAQGGSTNPSGGSPKEGNRRRYCGPWSYVQTDKACALCAGWKNYGLSL
jgi:hypothetical protein